jgi:YD repeat-containing protein
MERPVPWRPIAMRSFTSALVLLAALVTAPAAAQSDAAGQVTSLTYNPSGQVLTSTNPRSETSTPSIAMALL